MKASVKWHGRMSFTGSADTGFEVPLDSSPSVGGDNAGFRPLELMAVSLAGCTAMDVISILKKKQENVTDFDVRVEAQQAGEHPHVFTHIHIEYIVAGQAVKPEAVERSIELSLNRYCPANAMLSKVVKIDYSFQVIEAVGGTVE
jgi:putative redox protein